MFFLVSAPPAKERSETAYCGLCRISIQLSMFGRRGNNFHRRIIYFSSLYLPLSCIENVSARVVNCSNISAGSGKLVRLLRQLKRDFNDVRTRHVKVHGFMNSRL